MKKKIAKILLLASMSLSTVWIFWLSLTPIIDRDGTRFHLPFAKLWAENGFMYFREWFAYYDLNMLNLNYLYMLVFKFGLSDQFTKIIHASFLIAGGYLIYRYIKNKYGFNWGAISFLIYVTIPINQRLASEVYVDLGLLFFSTLSIIYFIKWFESDFTGRKYLIISALGAGLGLGTKYNGLIFAFFMTLFVALVVSREKKDDKLAVRSMLIYGTVIFVSVLPWLLRNYINSGNPFFPLFNSIIHSSISIPAEISENVSGETAWRIMSNGDNIFTLFLLPFRVFFEGADNDFLRFDGVLNPMLLILLPFVLMPKISINCKLRLNVYLLIIFFTTYLVTLYSNNIRIRYFLPALPILVILNIEGLKNILSLQKFKYAAYIGSAAFLLYNISYSFTLFENTHLAGYNPFSESSRQEYISDYVKDYEVFNFVNKNTPENSVVYETLTGGRSYYIKRTFYCDTFSIDRNLLSFAKGGASEDEYLNYFQKLPNSDLSATHLLIRPDDFIKTFTELYKSDLHYDNTNNIAELSGFIRFLQNLKFLYEKNGTCLFEISY